MTMHCPDSPPGSKADVAWGALRKHAAPSALAAVAVADRAIQATLARALESIARDVRVYETPEQAASISTLRPRWMAIDPQLFERAPREVVTDLVRVVPAPTIVVLCRSAEEGFDVACAGARGAVSPLHRPDVVAERVVRILREDVDPWIPMRNRVGLVPLADFIARVRELWFEEALVRARGSRSRAARLLGVSRQAVQQYTRRRDSNPTCAEDS